MIFDTDTTITTDQTITFGETWTVNPSVTLTINPGVTITNNGGGVIKNSGTIINDGNIINTNFSEIINDGNIINTNSGTITTTNDGYIYNYGTITNNEGIIINDIGGDIYNYGTITNNDGLIFDGGVMHNSCDGILNGTTPYNGYVDQESPCNVTPPTIIPVSDITVEAEGPDGVTVDYDLPTVFDDNDPYPTISCEPEPGSLFPIGTTPVTCTAQDVSGNTSTATFDVIVEEINIDTKQVLVKARDSNGEPLDATCIVEWDGGGSGPIETNSVGNANTLVPIDVIPVTVTCDDGNTIISTTADLRSDRPTGINIVFETEVDPIQQILADIEELFALILGLQEKDMELMDKDTDLQQQIDTIELTPGPSGEGSDCLRNFIPNGDLSNCFIPDFFFAEEDLSGVDFSGARLIDTYFFGTDLTNADFTDANISQAEFPDADLTGADFTGAINQPIGNIDCIGTPIGATFTCTG